MTVVSVLDTQTILSTTETTEQSATEIAAEEAEEQQIEFLNILLTQLANQNPLDPMDTDDFTSQLTQYSQLEQQIETNEQLYVISDLLSQSTQSASFSYIGQTVEVASNVGVVQDGEAVWTYAVDSDATDVLITVVNDDGDIIYEDEGSFSSGSHTVTLSTDDYDIEESEALTFYATATDSDGEVVDEQITSHITIDGVWSDDDQIYLTAGSVSVLVDGVLKVLESGTITEDAA